MTCFLFDSAINFAAVSVVENALILVLCPKEGQKVTVYGFGSKDSLDFTGSSRRIRSPSAYLYNIIKVQDQAPPMLKSIAKK
jgi:hypothetical protein